MQQIFNLKENETGITNANTCFDNIKKVNIDFKQENLIVLYIDSRNNVIKSEVLFKGGLNMCVVDAKTLFRQALKYNANALIIAHNHPSNDLNPSQEDKTVFEHFKKCGEILQLKVLDSIIFNKTEYYSLNSEVE